MGVDELKGKAHGIIRAALAAADPQAAVERALRGGEVGRLRPGSGGRLLLVAVGKAACAMSRGALASIPTGIEGVLVVLPRGYPCDVGAPTGTHVEVIESSHPVPDEAGVAAAMRVLSLVDSMEERDTCLLLLSGGGSSLLPLPHPPVTLRDKQEVTRLLLASGADIREINTVRKHLSAIKGGRLAERCRGRMVTLAVSDVVGDPVQFIASGPTVPDTTTFADAGQILARRAVLARAPASVRTLIEDGLAGRQAETPKSLPARHTTSVIASNSLAVQAAMAEAARLGFHPLLLTDALAGEAREAGVMLASAALAARHTGRPAAPPACIVAGGETTVSVSGRGRGGRNQEIALAAALLVEGEPGILLASFATDGREGNTDAAGAFASGLTAAAGRKAGLDPRACLASNDSHTFLSAAGDLIVTGPTGTNVNDVTFLLVE